VQIRLQTFLESLLIIMLGAGFIIVGRLLAMNDIADLGKTLAPIGIGYLAGGLRTGASNAQNGAK
jgi:hypothetical protein